MKNYLVKKIKIKINQWTIIMGNISDSSSNYGKHPTVKNLVEANKAIKKLQSSTLRLVYPDLGNPELLKVIVYGDATHASLPSGASQGALIVFLCGNERAAPITWKSKKLERVTKSPVASETMSLAEAADAGHFVALMTKEIFGLETGPLDLGEIEVQWVDKTIQLADPLTKHRASTTRPLDVLKCGKL